MTVGHFEINYPFRKLSAASSLLVGETPPVYTIKIANEQIKMAPFAPTRSGEFLSKWLPPSRNESRASPSFLRVFFRIFLILYLH